MSSDRNSTNYQQKQTYNSGANDLITSSGDIVKQQDNVQLKNEMDSYHVTTTMPHTKTMILQSTTGEFQYVNQTTVVAATTASAQEFESPGIIADDRSESGDGYETTLPPHSNTIKTERNGQAMILMDSAGTIAGRFSVGLTSLPPPPPPTVTISNSSGNHHHGPQTIIVGRAAAASASPTTIHCYGRLSYKDDILYISEHTTEIGRNSSTSTVHFHVGKNSFVSRKHLRLIHDSNEFYLMCLSKNGVFVNDAFQRKSSEPLKLPKT